MIYPVARFNCILINSKSQESILSLAKIQKSVLINDMLNIYPIESTIWVKLVKPKSQALTKL